MVFHHSRQTSAKRSWQRRSVIRMAGLGSVSAMTALNVIGPTGCARAVAAAPTPTPTPTNNGTRTPSESHGSPTSPAPSEFVTRFSLGTSSWALQRLSGEISRALQERSAEPNLANAGALQLTQGVHASGWFLFPYRWSHALVPHVRFQNFGGAGYILAETLPLPPATSEAAAPKGGKPSGGEPLSSFLFVSPVVANRPLLEAAPRDARHPWSAGQGSLWHGADGVPSQAHALLEQGGVRCLAARTRGHALPPGFDCGPRAPRGAAAPLSPACVPKGVRLDATLEEFGTRAGGTCFFQTQSTDARHADRPARSALACVSSGAMQGRFDLPDGVQAILPAAQKDVFYLYEGKYSPAKISRLNVAALTLQGIVQGVGAANALDFQSEKGSKAVESPLPPQVGIYECAQPSGGRTWLYVDSSVFLGRRALEPEIDAAWRAEEQGASVRITRLPWFQVIREFPSVNAFPGFACVHGTGLDVKCGVRVVQTTGQIAREALEGAHDEALSPDLRKTLYSTSAVALQRVRLELPHWQLAVNAAKLEGFFWRKARESGMSDAERAELTAPGPAAPGSPGSHHQVASHPADSPDAAETAAPRISDYLSLPKDLWDRL